MSRPDPTGADPLAGLDPEQCAVATAVHGPVAVLAGAGTGKTRAITHRIAYGVGTGVHDPRRSLALTFTARAAAEMRQRLRALGVEGVQARTFHSAALRQLRFFWARGEAGPCPEVIAVTLPVVAEAAVACGLPCDVATVRDLQAEVQWAKSAEVPPEDYCGAALDWGRRPVANMAAQDVARLYDAYEDALARRGAADFEDVLRLTAALLQERPDVSDEVARRYRWFTVDEFQDVSPLQHRLLDLWLGERDEVCVVGDTAQTIYSFAGATSRYLVDFRRRHPDATEIRLVRCYRCSPQVVAAANRLLAVDEAAAGPGRVDLRSQRPPGPEPVLLEHDDEVAEAESVAAGIGDLLAGGLPAREIAVLFRVNAAAQVVEHALTAAGIPYVVRGGDRYFTRPEVREALTRLRGAARAAADGTGDVAADLGAATRAVLAVAGWTPSAPAAPGQRARWESLAGIVALADDLATRRPSAGLPDLIADLAGREDAQDAPRPDAVTLATLHAAKGLEWEAVHVIGLAEGILPIVYADTADQLREERRLLYVGMTRARRWLVLSWSAARTPGAPAVRLRSRFLDDLAGATTGGRDESAVQAAGIVVHGSGQQRAEYRRRPPASCVACGKSLVTAPERTLGRCRTCPAGHDEELLDRLRRWRAAEARRRGLPDFAVVTETTLHAVAERRPTDAAELADIPGIGPRNAQRYAAQLLAIIGDRRRLGPVDLIR